MSISRLYNFPNVPQVMSGEIDAELNQLVAECNLKLDLSGGTISGGLTVLGAVQGARSLLTFGSSGFTGDVYTSLEGSSGSGIEFGVPMIGGGSVVGYSIFVNCTSFTGSNVFVPKLRKNGSDFFTGSTVTISGTGIQTASSNHARNTYAFVAGDRLSYFHDVTTGGTVAASIRLLFEIQRDT